jgi:hypothetical protein
MRETSPERTAYSLIPPAVEFQTPGGSSEALERLCRQKTHSRHATRTSLAEFKNASVCRTISIVPPRGAEADSTTSLDRLRARFARDEGLPSADVLTEAGIRDALNEHGVRYRDRVFGPVTTTTGGDRLPPRRRPAGAMGAAGAEAAAEAGCPPEPTTSRGQAAGESLEMVLKLVPFV